MDIVISTRDARPIYEQIKEQIESAIIRGVLTCGDQLPSIRALANDLDVSVITTKRAYADLEAAGFITSVQGRGCFVSALTADTVRDDRLRRIEESFYDTIQDGKRAGMNAEELLQVFKRCLEE